eukprot:232084_1
MAHLLKLIDTVISQIDAALEDVTVMVPHDGSLVGKKIEFILNLLKKRLENPNHTIREYHCPKMDAEFFACVQKDKDKCYERLKKESPLMPLDFLSNTYFISAMTIGHQANFPYFPYLCDVFLRQYHDYSENDYARPQSWMHYYEHEYLKHLQDDALTRTLLIAIYDYFNRLFPRMIVPQPTKISDSLPAVSAHVLMFCNIVKQLSSYDSITPYQLELCFLFKSFDIDDDSDDSDERDDSDESDDCDDFGIFG